MHISLPHCPVLLLLTLLPPFRYNYAQEEAQALGITYYDAIYYEPLGSIFPIVDLTRVVPHHLADVAILEEPEHLNWFQMADTVDTTDTYTDAYTTRRTHSSDEIILHSTTRDSKIQHNNNDTVNATSWSNRSHREDAQTENINVTMRDHRLAWKRKFRFVIGVIHTNYSAYMKQYGLGTALFTSPILDAMSSLVVRAYCHKIIRLSESVPTFAPHKEICCNVHGVRSTFFHSNTRRGGNTTTLSTITNLDTTVQQQQHKETNHDPVDTHIYFVGKLLWAKGLDKILQIQEEYRKVYGRYFSIDIYGSGPDEKAIQRAFFGRMDGIHTTQQRQGLEENQEKSIKENTLSDVMKRPSSSNLYEEIFKNSWSLKSQLFKLSNSTPTLLATNTTTTDAATLSSSSSSSCSHPLYDETLQFMTKSFEDIIATSHESKSPYPVHNNTTIGNLPSSTSHHEFSSPHSTLVHDLYNRLLGTGMETSHAMVQFTNFTL